MSGEGLQGLAKLLQQLFWGAPDALARRGEPKPLRRALAITGGTPLRRQAEDRRGAGFIKKNTTAP
jgi:hypothetical protein